MKPSSLFVFLTGLLCFAGATADNVKGFFIQVNENTISNMDQRVARVKREGYNTLILSLAAWSTELEGPAPSYQLDMGAGIPGGLRPPQLKDLVVLVRQYGLEPIFHIHLVGKVSGLFGSLMRTHPGLVYQGKHNAVWNPKFTLPSGGTLEEDILKPLLRELVMAYGERPPKYMLIGIDEVDKGALAAASKAEGLTPGHFLGREINRSTRMLLDLNVTPILFQDMLMSAELSNAGVVRGFDGDPRLAHFEPMNGSRKAFGGGNVMDAVDMVTNRDRIIVAAWHYFRGSGADESEYPSIDYFKKIGFKDVWGVPWYDMATVKDLSQYALRLGAGGMVASIWFIDLKPRYNDLAEQILRNSIRYFARPGIQRTHAPSLKILDEKNQCVVAEKGKKRVRLVAYGDLPSEIIRITYAMRTGKNAGWDSETTTEKQGDLSAAFTLPDASNSLCDFKVEVETRDGLLHLGYQEAGILIIP